MATASERLRRGDYVRVRLLGHSGEWARAFVALASDSDPSSVMLLFDDAAVWTGLGGVACNGLPLTIDYGSETVISLFGDVYEIEVAE